MAPFFQQRISRRFRKAVSMKPNTWSMTHSAAVVFLCLGLLAVAWLCTIGVTFSEEGDDSRRQRRYEEAAVALSKAQEATNAKRTITIRVLDYQGVPVANVPLVLIGNRYRAVVLPLVTKFHDVVTLRAKTDVDGKATFGPVVVGDMSIGIELEGLPNGLDVESDEAYYVPGPNNSVRDRGPRTAPGIDFQLYVHRFVGPRPLFEMPPRRLENAPLDGTPVEWPFGSPYYGNRDAGESLEEGMKAELSIRLWRDPAVSYMVSDPVGVSGGRSVRRRVNYEAAYWMEIEARNGGLREVEPPSADPRQVCMAPADGYLQRVSWAYDPAIEKTKDGDVSLAEASGRDHWFWWVRNSGQGSVYALLSFRCLYGYDYSKALPRVTIEAEGVFNPTAGDRLIERPTGRRAVWVTEFTRDKADEWFKRVEPWLPYPAIPVPPLQAGWPPRAQNSAP